MFGVLVRGFIGVTALLIRALDCLQSPMGENRLSTLAQPVHVQLVVPNLAGILRLGGEGSL